MINLGAQGLRIIPSKVQIPTLSVHRSVLNDGWWGALAKVDGWGIGKVEHLIVRHKRLSTGIEIRLIIGA
jgi:hypothetical protein